MQINIEARADSRALAGGLVLGAAVGVLLGGAYLAGGESQAVVAHARVLRLADAAADGFAERALKAEAGAMAPGALAVARRHDPFTTAGGAQRDRQDVSFASLFARAPDSVQTADANAAAPDLAAAKTLMLRASQPAPVRPARPFHFASGGALDSSRDLDCLTEAVYYEARGETAAGQAAVAQVVLNRVRHPSFPKTVCGVVFQGAHADGGCQFSFACDGSTRAPREPGAWRQAEKVAARALEGFVMPSVGSATHFHVAGLDPGWGPRLLRVAQIGLHVFYRFGYGGGASNLDATPQRSGDEPELTPHPVYASMAPLGGVSADGRALGGLILANATVTPAPASAPPAPQAAVPPVAAKPVAPAEATPKTDPAAKPETAAATKAASAAAAS